MMKRLGIAVLACLAVSASALAQRREVILTTDCGTEIDDQWAIVYLFLNPQFHVKGIVSTHAPNLPDPKSETSANCVRDVLDRLHITSRPPVFAGSNVPLPSRGPLRNAGVDFIVNASRSYSSENRLLILTIGATTDVGSAFLQDPTLGERVEILTMGFNLWPRGTDPWNIKNDPLAYSVILESSAPLTIGSAGVCRAHLKLDMETVRRIFGKRGATGKWMTELFQNWITWNWGFVSRDVGPQQWVVWDTIVVAHMLGYTRSNTYPRPALNTADLTFAFPKTNKTVKWITDVDEKQMWADFVAKLDRHNMTVPGRAAHSDP